MLPIITTKNYYIADLQGGFWGDGGFRGFIFATPFKTESEALQKIITKIDIDTPVKIIAIFEKTKLHKE